MVITDIATYTREQTGVTVQNITDPQLYRYLNIAYHEIENAIVTDLNEDFFWNEMTFDLVNAQAEYAVFNTTVDGNTRGVNKVISLAVDFNWNGQFVDATITTGDDLESKRNGTSAQYPLFRVMDWSIEIFPTPNKAVTAGGKIRVVQHLIDLTSGTTEANIYNGRIHPNYHYFIALGAMEHIYRQRKLENDSITARNVFLSKLYGDWWKDIGLLGMLGNRTISTMKSIEPNTIKFR